ncbi:hypothetical protein HLB76_004328 [Salmonella enterica]|jgi:hypothetical protein|uniref:Uncharacterized protein n=1 Tax=Salmonella enterica TaxID=28901 RepID=A0A756ANU6_SALER|nr:hypothetical protein [Salmonella enterica]ECA4425276.1 hypothetical protein [Salmonella enterica subsp. enterica serovar Anatum]ECH8994482.1 hypothetical protein [Salmonella enterica subsp. enterica serovar Javiana]ECU5334826.1 hypothetical protein [Salmonella enterica subsp. enterica serovar Braenderup]EDG3219345.1 hypothetical protein [Salmonella enterica subsp. enterica serovar Infantis]EFW3315128.1 hypothetical protein [Shigella flexneri]EJR7219273.1 hypothetical protein [Salmonella en
MKDKKSFDALIEASKVKPNSSFDALNIASKETFKNSEKLITFKEIDNHSVGDTKLFTNGVIYNDQSAYTSVRVPNFLKAQIQEISNGRWTSDLIALAYYGLETLIKNNQSLITDFKKKED